MVQTHVKHYGCIKNWKYHACVGSAQMLLVVQLNVVVRIVLHTHTHTHTCTQKDDSTGNRNSFKLPG